MKTLTSNMSTFLSTNKTNVEPVIILKVDWSGDGQEFTYADRDVSNVEGKILAMGDLESLLSSKTGSSNTLQFTLDDTDGSIKTLLDQFDPYGKPCFIYQYFHALSLTLDDKILMFKGQINYDVAWNEGERTVTLTVITKVEEREVGFSPEEGQFDFVSQNAVGKPWPLCYGSPLHVPCTLVSEPNIATLNDRICFVDPLLLWKREILYKAILANYAMHKYYQEVALSSYTVQGYTAQSLLTALLDALKSRQDQIVEYNTILEELNVLKASLWLAIRGRGPGNPAAIRQQINAKRAEKRLLEDDEIGPIHGTIEILEDLIPRLEASIEQRSNSLDKQYEAINQLSKLYQEYLAVDFEIGRQQKCVTTDVYVRDGDNFEQDTVVDVFINNMRFRGTFHNDVFTINAMLPKYQNITLDPRETIADPYSQDDHYSAFWVPDESIRLEGLYILVTSSRDGNKHIAKVTSQEGRLCRIELANHSRNTQSDEINAQVNWSSPSVAVGTEYYDGTVIFSSGLFPVGDFNTAIMDSYISEVTRPDYMTSLGFLPFDVQQFITNNSISLNRDTYELLLRLSKIREKDNQLYVVLLNSITPVKAYTLTTYDFTEIHEASPIILSHWLTDDVLIDELPESIDWTAEQGTVIISADDSCQIHIANIISTTTVHSVSAFRTFNGHRSLVTIPTRYYTEQEETLGVLTLRTVRTHLPLSALNEGWEDTIYVSQTSSVGPNVVDVIQHLVETYTDKSVDSTSFTAVHALVDNYPVHFALLERKNVFEQINEIALLARCVVYVINDVYYIKYLSVEPTPVRTITESDVIQGTMAVQYSDLTDVVTRLVAVWNRDYSGDAEPNKLTLRHNIRKYGLHKDETDYYIYNIEELVKKSATFWLIRYCNSWKRVQFDLNVEHLDLETFDAVTLDLPHIADSATLAVIEDMNYNTERNTVTLSLWLPILSGQMEQYEFAWPGSADSNAEFALDNEDVGSGNAIVTGTLPDCL